LRQSHASVLGLMIESSLFQNRQEKRTHTKNMKKVWICLLLLFPLCLLCACDGSQEVSNEKIGDGVSMLAKVQDVGERITVDVIESEYTSGIYWVITPEETEYFDPSGSKITREDIKVGDTVEIRYGGQVMQSYPPQIVAARITVLQ
jgi:hypothetical protein